MKDIALKALVMVTWPALAFVAVTVLVVICAAAFVLIPFSTVDRTDGKVMLRFPGQKG